MGNWFLSVSSSKLFNWLSKNSTLFATVALTVFVYWLIIIIQSKGVVQICNRWGKDFKYYSPIETRVWLFLSEKETKPKSDEIYYNIDEYLTNTNISESYQKRIKEQVFFIRGRAITSLRVARDFYYWMIVFTVTLSISTIAAGIFGYPIIKKGWDSTNNYQKSVFLISLGISIFIASFQSFCQPKKNAETFMSVYQNYVTLEEYIVTSLTIQKFPDTPDEKPTNYAEDLIIKTDKILARYSLNIEFDPQSIPKLTDVIESIETKPRR
ncbi:MAG: hypothetical protein AB4057_09745 [Crocosphaera sp.]